MADREQEFLDFLDQIAGPPGDTLRAWWREARTRIPDLPLPTVQHFDDLHESGPWCVAFYSQEPRRGCFSFDVTSDGKFDWFAIDFADLEDSEPDEQPVAKLPERAWQHLLTITRKVEKVRKP